MAVEVDHKPDARLPADADEVTSAASPRAMLGRTALTGYLRDFDRTLKRALAPLAGAVNEFFAWLAESAVWRYISSTLLRRIVVSNLLGLIVLFFGVLYLSQYNVWLIDAKRDSLHSQGRIIAGAIASTLSRSRQLDRAGSGPFLGDENPFADLMFTLDPQRVTPVLRRLLAGTHNRARVYDRRGNLVAHSLRLLPPRELLDSNAGKKEDRPTTKNLWTKLKQWFLSSELGVYKELDDANGQLYPEVRQALLGKSEALLLLTRSGQQIVSVATPIKLADTVQGVLLLSSRPGEVDEALAEERMGIFALALVALCASMLASYLLARTVAGPMRVLSGAAQKVTRNIRTAQNLPNFEDREDEVGQLARSFRAMTSSLYRRIEASEKFAADVAHELKNPLTAARSTAESLGYAKTDAQRDTLVVQIQEELARLNKLITDISNASRMDAELALHAPEPVDLAAVVRGISETFQDIYADTEKRIALHVDAAAAVSRAYVVSGHEGRLGQVVTNLIDNALSFSPPDGLVDVRLRREGPNVVLSVADQGPGIEPDKLQTIFERFYTYRPSEQGSRGGNSGLGLSISREIIAAHGGRIWAENRMSNESNVRAGSATDAGARFIIQLQSSDADGRPSDVKRAGGNAV